MEEEKYFFYLPPGSFTSFELLSILYKPPDYNLVTLQIQFNETNVTLPYPKKEGEMLKWSADSAPDFSCSRVSSFNLIANDVSIPVDFNDMTLISSPKNFNPEKINNIFVFCFFSGYFARKSDYEILSLQATPNLKFINTNRLEAYQSMCAEYKDKLSNFEEIRNNKLKEVLDNRKTYQEKSEESRIHIFEEYKQATKDSPVLNLNYTLEPKDHHLQSSAFSTVFQTSINFSSQSTSLSFKMPTSKSNPELKDLSKLTDFSEPDRLSQNVSDTDQNSIVSFGNMPLPTPKPHLGQRRASLSATISNENIPPNDSITAASQIINSQQQINQVQMLQKQENQDNDQTTTNLPNQDKQHFFPESRQGPRSPSQAEIKMFLSELPLIFPIDIEKRMFCNICADDNDVTSSKMLLFNVIHFLTLFAEFTGFIYHYRITMADGGWYKLEDRLTGIEVKREITTKNVLTSPIRNAVVNCLKKIVYEFNLKTKDNDDIISLLDAVLNFYKELD
ncbi:hypothetical protein M9Y10_022170 [Tritrichomonas musculus]|uniref:Uncharacterized protein n=1 Tax=Tritrichomonas musculus TaxID=1915356 RepID=A0ABR2KRT7_9EUKA